MQSLKRSQLKQDILELLTNSEDILFDFKRQIENKSIVILVGNTRSGKSTLLNYIAGVPLVAVQHDDTFKIECDGPADVKHGTLSNTTIPTVVECPKYPGIFLVDAPGFDDNRSARQDIFNALYINQIKYAKAIQFVLVSDVVDILNDNINNFVHLIDTVKSIMPVIKTLKNVVTIVFTKVPNDYSLSSIVAILQQKFVSTDREDLVQHFIDHPNLIAIFKLPDNAGPITHDLGDNIDRIVVKNVFVGVNQLDIKFGISFAAKIILLDAYLDFFTIGQCIKTCITNFTHSTRTAFECLDGDKLLLLHEEHFNNRTENICSVVIEYCQKVEVALNVSGMLEIPTSLNIILDDLGNFCRRLRNLQITIDDMILNLPKVEEVKDQLEYLNSIEKVVEMDQQSKSILNIYQNCTQVFYNDIKALYNRLKNEKAMRVALKDSVIKIPEIMPILERVNDDYIQASTHSELVVMQKEVKTYDELVQRIIRGIERRPHLNQKIQEEMGVRDFSFVRAEINRKMQEIQHHINLQKDDINIVPLITMLLVPTLSGIAHYTDYKFAAVSLVGFLFVCYRSKDLCRVAFRNHRRWKQNRLFRYNTILDGCCYNLIRNCDLY